MSAHTVKSITFAKRPQGQVTSEALQLTTTTLPPVQDNELRLKTIYLSVDPYMRGAMRSSWQVGQVQSGWSLVQVLESKVADVPVNAYYVTMSQWQEEVVMKKPDYFVPVPGNAPEYLAIVGIGGLTAIIGIDTIGKIKAGETVVVSGAAGSVGILVGQIAKIRGCHVIGICGSDEKCKLLTSSYKFDHAINYKTHNTTAAIAAEIKKASPKGVVDVYFDNVGGFVSDAIIELLTTGTRIVVCGQISIYNEDDPSSQALLGPRHWHKLIYTGAKIEGFTIGQHTQQWPAYIKQLLQWYTEGKLQTPISVEVGLENFAKGFLNLFSGENKGKQVIKVSH